MFPGYKHVREFGPDDRYEEEEEEVCYVTLDLGPDVDKALLPNSTECRLAGLDTETPMLQLAGSFFIGRHQELIGTELLFTDGRDENNPSRRFVVPFGMTEQRIEFKQVDAKRKVNPMDEMVPATASSSSKPRRSSKKGKGKAKSSKAKGKEPERNESEGDEPERDGLEEEEQSMDIE
ncbi:hypothetical protein Clacol_008529 [Clathrus columnatus]|uniref:Transcription factor TFIIIC triple barrel domain-containing protein n=1 Tax=Clathrus columnatus TaxID=1419009 RepID=A0AAV5AIT6_9AGAM|nr:hypothetical protein Clacol_008529 [Clathrus columnatus]